MNMSYDSGLGTLISRVVVLDKYHIKKKKSILNTHRYFPIQQNKSSKFDTNITQKFKLLRENRTQYWIAKFCLILKSLLRC